VRQELRSLENLSYRENIDLLRKASVGRVVFSDFALPAVVPMTFAVHGAAVVMRTAGGTRLSSAADGGVLAFEVDDIDPVSRTGWSVVVIGVASIITDTIEQSVIRGLVEPFAPGANDVAVRLPMTMVTGRRVVVAGADGDRTTRQ
jgi:nitroimidazol reductase NimA-like FMN-containing flavoprotein (pyridoxamine 5'-phosphate oxidase superfamily)